MDDKERKDRGRGETGSWTPPSDKIDKSYRPPAPAPRPPDTSYTPSAPGDTGNTPPPPPEKN